MRHELNGFTCVADGQRSLGALFDAGTMLVLAPTSGSDLEVTYCQRIPTLYYSLLQSTATPVI